MIRAVITMMIMIMMLASPAWAQACRPYDGDSLKCGRERIRIMGLDTPELGDKARCPLEHRLAEAARDKLASLLQSGEVRIERRGLDKYRRRLARVYVGGEDVAGLMIAAGMARAYEGGRRQPWCE